MNPYSFHSHHSPFGAFASFTIGLEDSPGGFAQSLGRPSQARQNVYIGFRAPDGPISSDQRPHAAPWRLLPFFNPPESEEFRYTQEAAVASSIRADSAFTTLSSNDYQRSLEAASDTWRADDDRFGFSLLTPFEKIPDPRSLDRNHARRVLSPTIPAWIEYDNRDGSETVELIFGVGNPERPFRPLNGANPQLAGFAAGTSCGYATPPCDAVELRQGFDVFQPKYRDYRGLHVIGGESALIFSVAPGEFRRFPIAIGFFATGTVTTGISASYAYTRFFSDLEDALVHCLAAHDNSSKVAAARDSELASRGLSEDQRFLLAQAIHSYWGSTQLMWNDDGPLWIVNEGEYRMMNTFDLTVDHIFFELDWHPWAVRDTLELFVKRYAYTDRIRIGDSEFVDGGISFTHDMGVMNHFTDPGRSSYECDELSGCFSHMTMEQLLNWVLSAVTYAKITDDFNWLNRHRETLLECVTSLHRRDDPDPKKRNGILKHDSSRCGREGGEITTYDSLDVSLGQARNNLYLAVKTLGTWILLEKAFIRLNLPDAADDARVTADLLAKTLTEKFEPESGFFPAVFENGNRSRILPAVEGFIYPLYLDYDDVTAPDGRFGELLALLRQHLSNALQPGVCIDPTTGGWKISNTSTNTWFSKIALVQYALRNLFPEISDDLAAAADRVHSNWQRQPACGKDAMCDQIESTNGESRGSRYYPRGVTAWLWLQDRNLPSSTSYVKNRQPLTT